MNRAECPYCKREASWEDSSVNQGWLEFQCRQCKGVFFVKITATNVNVDVRKERPEGS